MQTNPINLPLKPLSLCCIFPGDLWSTFCTHVAISNSFQRKPSTTSVRIATRPRLTVIRLVGRLDGLLLYVFLPLSSFAIIVNFGHQAYIS